MALKVDCTLKEIAQKVGGAWEKWGCGESLCCVLHISTLT